MVETITLTKKSSHLAFLRLLVVEKEGDLGSALSVTPLLSCHAIQFKVFILKGILSLMDLPIHCF